VEVKKKRKGKGEVKNEYTGMLVQLEACMGEWKRKKERGSEYM
jgi:hypothetical protein